MSAGVLETHTVPSASVLSHPLGDPGLPHLSGAPVKQVLPQARTVLHDLRWTVDSSWLT